MDDCGIDGPVVVDWPKPDYSSAFVVTAFMRSSGHSNDPDPINRVTTNIREPPNFHSPAKQSTLPPVEIWGQAVVRR